MAQRGATTRHDVGFSMLDDGRLIGGQRPRLQRHLLWWQPCRLHSKIRQATRLPLQTMASHPG